MMPDVNETERFRGLLAERLGLWFDDREQSQLAEVLRSRIARTGSDSVEAYLRRLATTCPDREELQALATELTVAETYFFRHTEQLRAFVEVALPHGMRRRAGAGPLRILSAGCASGEEPYSLAMLVRGAAAHGWPGEISILGIDVNPALLHKAQRAHYSSWSLRQTPQEIQQRSFQPSGREFALDEAVRRMVRFENRNLVEEDAGFWRAGAFDIIFCRNVTIYFPPKVTRAVIARLSRSLAPGGFLFLGPSETLRGVSQDFHLRQTHETFYYQRRDHGEPRPVPLPATEWPAQRPSAAALAIEREMDDSWVGAIAQAAQRVATLVRPQEQAPRPGKAADATGLPQTWDLGLALDLLRQERFQEAIAALRARPPQSQNDPDALLLEAVVLTHAAQVEAAERVCRRLLAADETNAGAHYLMALCREHAGDRPAAVRHDQAAIRIDPAFAMPHLHLGLMARRAGDTTGTGQELRQALALLAKEHASRILLFGGGFSREALIGLCRGELRAGGGGA